MTMYQLPVRAVAAVHVGDPQRDVLVGQVAHPCVLSFDHYQNQRVAPGMRLEVLQLGLAVPERAAPGPQLGGSFLVAAGRSPVGRQQREAVRVVQEVEVAVYVPLDVCGRGLLGAAYELGQLLVGDGGVHPTSLVMACPRGPEVRRSRAVQHTRGEVPAG